MPKTKEIGAVKARLWVSNDMSFWSLVEQIRSRKGLKDANETLFYCAMVVGRQEGLETG